MPAPDDIELLRDYAIRGSEAAFETIVSRRVRFVYAAALRQVRDPHMAEEVTQAVFIILAQKAGSIREKTILTGWLFKTTRFVALAQTRALARRRQYEQEAHLQTESNDTSRDALWEQVSPSSMAALRISARRIARLCCCDFLRTKVLRKSAARSAREKIPPECASIARWKSCANIL